jgi:hypothetical protein
MTHTQKRKIVVNDIKYEWCIRGNHIWKDTDHITIYKDDPSKTGTALYLDPFPWGLEIRPRTIANAIRFALRNNWNPEQKGKPIRIGYVNDDFVLLPEGIKNSHEYKSTLKE